MGITTVGLRTAIAAAAVLAASTFAANALESNATANSALSADALWKKIGSDFCGISKWHPAIEKCELSADHKTRTLSLKGGGTIVETLEKLDFKNRSYTYTIVSGPLPVSNYHSTIAVAASGKGSVVTWNGKYDASGASDTDAQKAIQGVYDSGLEGLTKSK